MIKRFFSRLSPGLLLPALLLCGGAAAEQSRAEQSRTFGDYTIHYSAFPSELLLPAVAKNYRIKRSKNRALINVSVLKKHLGTTGLPVKAEVEATARNLSQQLRGVEFKEIRVESAIYYLGQVRVDNEETLDIELNITPEGESAALSFTFRQQFFTE